MKHFFFSALLLVASSTAVFAQSKDKPTNLSSSLLSSGTLYQGLSRSVPNARVVLPYGLEVTFDKTTHLIFPAPIRYVDLGSQNIIAGKAEDAENVLRIKAAVQDFETETNLSVICEDGSFYAFNVKYAAEPEKLNIEMQDFLAPTAGRLPSNRSDIYFKELGSESPILVKLIMQSIYQSDKRGIKHIGAQQFGMKFLLRGLYAHNGLFYFYTRIDNDTNMPFAVDFVTFKVVDKKVAKRTAMQEQRLVPGQKGLEVSASVPIVKGKSLFKQDDFGLTFLLSHYLKRDKYTFVSAGYEQQALSYRSYQVPLRDYLVQMGYAHPLLSDKGKNVFFYLGTSALVGYGHKLQKGEHFSSNMPEWQADSLLRADLMAQFNRFKCYGKDALLLSLLAYNVGAGRIPGTKTQRKSQLLRKIESGDRNDIQEYLSFCHYKGKILRGLVKRRRGEFLLFFLP